MMKGHQSCLSLAGLVRRRPVMKMSSDRRRADRERSGVDRIMSEKEVQYRLNPSPALDHQGSGPADRDRGSQSTPCAILQRAEVEPAARGTTWGDTYVSGMNSNQLDLGIAGTSPTSCGPDAVQFTKPIWYRIQRRREEGPTPFLQAVRPLNREGQPNAT